MARILIICAAILFCVVNAPAPDPRIAAAISAAAQDSNQQVDDSADWRFYCPMDSDVRSSVPGTCPRCGMKLVEGVKDSVEYPIDLKVEPETPRVAETTRLTFGIVEPNSGRPVRDFEIVHEKLYHVFVVSHCDLTFFFHTHPERDPGQDFHLDVRFPKPGMYRVLSDFYPSGGTPQLITNTVMIPGDGFSLQPAHIAGDVSPQRSEEFEQTQLVMPSGIMAREKVTILFRVTPDDEERRAVLLV